MYTLLYKIYVLLRSDKFGLIKNDMSVETIYGIILEWMISTTYFNESGLDTTIVSDISKTINEMKSTTLLFPKKSIDVFRLFDKEEYTYYYPALMTHLHSKTNSPIKRKEELIKRNIEELPILYDISKTNFPPNFVNSDIKRLVDNNIKKNNMSLLSKSIFDLNYDKVIAVCSLKQLSGNFDQSPYFTFECVKPIYNEWIKIFNTYISKISSEEDTVLYMNTIETAISSLDSPNKKALLEYVIIMYFQYLSQKESSVLKQFEKRMAERYLMKAIVLSTSKVNVNQVRGFTNFMIGCSDYQIFGRYLKFIDNGESEFHAYNIFYIVLFSQMNEAKRLKLLKKENEMKEILLYRNELTKTFEKRYPNLIQILSNDAKKKPLRFIKSIHKADFFLNFMDFFDLFYVHSNERTNESNPIFHNQFISIHTVFINFYHFLYSLRSVIQYEVESPYEFVLEKLEKCLKYSSRPIPSVENKELEIICVFSNRKYSEMYFFFKIYLILKEKIENVTLDNFDPEQLNTHLRMFFIYAVNDKSFKKVLESKCNKEPYKWIDLCISWTIFLDFHHLILDSTHRGTSFSYVKQFMTQKVLSNPNQESHKHIKLNILFAAEAISLLVDGKGTNYNRFISLFSLDEQYALVSTNNSALNEEDITILNLFKIKKEETENRQLLIQYLKRTYFKKSRTSDEQAATLAISSILDASKGPQDKIFTSYFSFAGHILVNYIKFFLIYATNDSHYEKIADFLILHNVFFELANLNRPSDDAIYKSILEKLSLQDPNYNYEKKNHKPTSQYPHNIANYREILFNSFNRRYQKIVESMSQKLTEMSQVNQKKNVEDDEQNFDIFSEFMDSEVGDLKVTVLKEQKEFMTVNHSLKKNFADWKTNPSMKEIKIYTLAEANDEHMQTKSQTNAKESIVTMEAEIKIDIGELDKLEMKTISNEPVDVQNFGFSEKTIIKNYCEKVAEEYGVYYYEFDQNIKTSTLLETLVVLGNETNKSKKYLSLLNSKQSLKTITDSHRKLRSINKLNKSRIRI